MNARHLRFGAGLAALVVALSGQVTIAPDGLKYVGVIGNGLSMEQGQEAARLCAMGVVIGGGGGQPS